MEQVTVTVTVNNLQFDVSVSGDISQPQRVNNVIIDEVRLAAAEHFLALRTVDLQGLGLTKAQKEYWSAVRTVTPVEKRGKF